MKAEGSVTDVPHVVWDVGWRRGFPAELQVTVTIFGLKKSRSKWSFANTGAGWQAAKSVAYVRATSDLKHAPLVVF